MILVIHFFRLNQYQFFGWQISNFSLEVVSNANFSVNRIPHRSEFRRQHHNTADDEPVVQRSDEAENELEVFRLLSA